MARPLSLCVSFLPALPAYHPCVCLSRVCLGLSDGRGLLMTVASYETPRGDSIQGKGISPDIETKALPATDVLGSLGIMSGGAPDVSMVDSRAFNYFADGSQCPAPLQ